jgi:hypothetical protein
MGSSTYPEGSITEGIVVAMAVGYSTITFWQLAETGQ